jgi:hypothetical protein
MSTTNVYAPVRPQINWNFNVNSSRETHRLWEEHKDQLPKDWNVVLLGKQVYFHVPTAGFVFFNDHFRKHLEENCRPTKWTFGVSIFNEEPGDTYQDKIQKCLELGTFTIELGGKPGPARIFKRLKAIHGVPAIQDIVIW